MTAATPTESRYAGMANLIGVASRTRLGFLALFLLLLESAGTTYVLAEDEYEGAVLAGMGFCAVLALVVFMFEKSRDDAPVTSAVMLRPDRDSEDQDDMVARDHQDEVWPPKKEAPSINAWRDVIRPLSHQALQYAAPAYFLDDKLNVVGWNVSFGIIFAPILEEIRGRHINHFISRMKNRDAVFDHAREFTRMVSEREVLPLVDTEELSYQSPRWGDMTFLKVAVLLHDAEARPRAWSVTLVPKDIDWQRIGDEIRDQMMIDKLWSVYAASYDRVLLEFPPYAALIHEVVGGVEKPHSLVLDLGAGTGNASRALLEDGHRVVALENNQGMLDQLETKGLDESRCVPIQASAEGLRSFESESFDAVVAVNVIYALEDPLACLRQIHRVLKPGGTLSFSTTHRGTQLTPLLKAIENELRERGLYERLESDYLNVYNANRTLEDSIVRRHTAAEYREWVEAAGFKVFKEIAGTYHDAVLVLHARKAEDR